MPNDNPRPGVLSAQFAWLVATGIPLGAGLAVMGRFAIPAGAGRNVITGIGLACVAYALVLSVVLAVLRRRARR